jgi:hypothetical protein
MMVELLRAAIATEAVMAVYLHIPVANHTESQILWPISMDQLFVDHERIHWIRHGEKDIVVGYH